MLPEELDEFGEERRKKRKIKSLTEPEITSKVFVYILCALLTLEMNKKVFVTDYCPDLFFGGEIEQWSEHPNA